MLTRRLLPLATLALGLGLSACGSDDPGPREAAADTGGTFPVVLEHMFGTTEIPEAPERVVTVGFNDQDFVLALGITPVGTREYLGYDYDARPWAADLLDGDVLPTVGGEEIDIEAVAALEPDLIVGVYSFMDEATYDLLSGIAPVVAQSDEYEVGGTPWQEQTLLTGRALGREEEAEQLVEDVEARFAEVRSVHPEFADRALAVDYGSVDSHFVLEEQDLRNRFFADLGFAPPAETGEVSLERMDALDQDVLVAGGYTREEISREPLFSGLAVVREDRTVYIGTFDGEVTAALGFGSPLSLPHLMDLVVPALAQAADGDPATAVEQPAA
ncbi:iron-siderophore ABC transporter substrate-binding protein [Geodermatophilus ruber]|uniref:Iron complex transport system substrate-binding protein n=1 Tax=Geodermatophilus ruber TaxID=504800 RepID=A0A1I3ZCR2_9ACTN|nr:iron-siderophore ABC transporter substrate-binding protein [Geodermatophilus ruber]SFK41914.1 iron complex transport system substrate-binding protein [Geodermatophilus ruber]